MKRTLLLFTAVLLIHLSGFADLGISASAVYLDINGSASFYSTQRSSSQTISLNNLNAQLGVFGLNSGNLKLIGGELRTLKNSLSTICGGNLFYLIYPKFNRPAILNFSSISLGVACTCNGNSFNTCGGGSCTSLNEQKLQNLTRSVDLTNFSAGDYTLEIYYEISGDNTPGNCSLQKLDNAGGNNYRSDFTIIDPLAVDLTAFGGICTDNSIRLKWATQTDLDIVKYEIEKSSTGLVFTPIGNVNSTGTTTEAKYIFNDNDPIIGTNYYRLRVYHKNRAVNISPIVRIYFGKVGNTIFIYPNPSGAQLAVRFAAVTKGHYQLSVFSNDGQRITTTPIDHDGTDKTIKITLPQSLPKGIYRLFLIDKTKFFKQAFLIK